MDTEEVPVIPGQITIFEELENAWPMREVPPGNAPHDHENPRSPGTVGYGADGMCRTCRRRSGIKKTTPDCCVKCEKKMRPVGTKIKDYPGTSLHSGKGVCDSCDKRERRLRQGPKPKTVKVVEPEPEVIITPEVIEALGSFMHQRRERIAERERLDRAFHDAEAVRRRFIANRYGVAA